MQDHTTAIRQNFISVDAANSTCLGHTFSTDGKGKEWSPYVVHTIVLIAPKNSVRVP